MCTIDSTKCALILKKNHFRRKNMKRNLYNDVRFHTFTEKFTTYASIMISVSIGNVPAMLAKYTHSFGKMNEFLPSI